jgi:hypothetical protein
MSGVDDELIPLKITVTDREAAALEEIAVRRRIERRSKQIGKGTIASEVIARVFAEHQDLLREWFGDDLVLLLDMEPIKHPKDSGEPQPETQVARRKRK